MSTLDPVAELRKRSWSLQAEVFDRIDTAVQAGGKEGGFALFAEGNAQILPKLAALERATRSVVYNLQPKTPFDPQRRERAPNRHTKQRGIQGHMIAAPTPHLSLIAACHPDTWIAPVEFLGLVIDERLALVPGPIGSRGKPTAWLCSHSDLVMQICDLWSQTKRLAIPIRDVPGVRPLTERQLNVVSLLCLGYKDAAIARHLGVSLRTVTGDISRILESLGVSTRWEAGIIIGRASAPGAV